MQTIECQDTYALLPASTDTAYCPQPTQTTKPHKRGDLSVIVQKRQNKSIARLPSGGICMKLAVLASSLVSKVARGGMHNEVIR